MLFIDPPPFLPPHCSFGMPFRFQGRYVFLTYSQVEVNDDNTKQNLANHLMGLASRKPFGFCIVGHERHVERGGYHFHAFISFERKLDTSNERKFDWNGYHPNIAACPVPKNFYNYTIKNDSPCDLQCCADGHTYLLGTVPDTFAAERESRNQLWGRLLDESSSADDFMSKVRVADPYTFATRYQALDCMSRAVFRTREPYTSPYEPQDFKLPEGVESWLLEEFDEEVRTLDRPPGPTFAARPSAFPRDKNILGSLTGPRLLIQSENCLTGFLQSLLGQRRPTKGPHPHRRLADGEDRVGP